MKWARDVFHEEYDEDLIYESKSGTQDAAAPPEHGRQCHAAAAAKKKEPASHYSS